MTQTIYSPIRKFKLLIILPLIAGVFYAFAAPEYKYDNGTENQNPKQALYTISKEKVDISFTPQLEKTDLETIKAELAKLGMAIDYTSLDFSLDGKLKKISAKINSTEGNFNFNSGELTPTNYPVFKSEPDGTSGIYFQKGITGKVISEDGDPLKGASVIISGKTIGTITDNDGNFVLQMTDETPLVISYVGYESLIVTPAFEKEMLITMKKVMIGVDEVTVVGYGINPQQSSSGTETFKVHTNPPLQLRNLDGSPAQPLIVIDGVIAENQNANNIPSETIESISVLKNESATAMYGEKGKNGVVLITLKRDSSFKNGPIDLKVNGFDNAKKENTVKESDVYTIVEQMPTFPGGEEALRNFMAANVKYPALATQKGIQGKVYISFVVTKTGSVANAKVARSVDPSVDQEAIRVVELLPSWKPGMQNGKYVDVEYTIPINFVLEPSKISNEKLKGTDSQDEQPYTVVEQMPEFPGGEQALRNFMAANVRYPASAHEKGIQGKVYIKFVVTKTGKVTNIEVVRGVDPSLDQEGVTVTTSSIGKQVVRGVDPSLDREAIRVITLLPTWKPGMQNGKNVDVEYTIPINFKLENATENEIKSAVDQTAQKHELIIVPNPTSDKAVVTLKGSESKNNLEVSVYDSYGKLISKESKNGPTFTLSVAKLTTGTYLVIAKDGRTQFQGHLLVNH